MEVRVEVGLQAAERAAVRENGVHVGTVVVVQVHLVVQLVQGLRLVLVDVLPPLVHGAAPGVHEEVPHGRGLES